MKKILQSYLICESRVFQLFSSFYSTASHIDTLFLQCKINLDSLEAHSDGMPGIVLEKWASYQNSYYLFLMRWFLTQGYLKCLNKNKRKKEKENDLIVCQPNQARNIFKIRISIKTIYLTLKAYENWMHFLIQKEMLRFDRVSNLCRVEALRFVFV